MNAVLYPVKTGCQRRNLPSDFPKWKAVQMFYYRACKAGTRENVQRELVRKTRAANGKSENPTYALIDSQSVKTVCESENRGVDGSKKRKDESGTLGCLLAIHVLEQEQKNRNKKNTELPKGFDLAICRCL